MAKKNDKAFGLLFLVGIVVLIISKIFEFIYDNIVVIGILLALGLTIYAIAEYIEHKEIKKQKEKQIQNAMLKSIEEKKAKEELQIKEKYKQEKQKIERSKENLLIKLNDINTDLSDLHFKTITATKIYNPLESISKLNNILKTERISGSEIWNLFYDTSEYDLINPKNQFEQRIKYLGSVDEPNYFEILNINNEVNNNQSNLIEQKKVEYNKNLKSIYNTSLEIIKNHLNELTEKYSKKGEIWSSDFAKFERLKKEKNDNVDLLKSEYFKKDKNAITTYYDNLLTKITYDVNFHKSININYNNENQVLIIEYLLPSIEQFPNVKENRYIKTRNEFKQINYSERELNNLYDDIIYRIVLDLISISFNNDINNSINSIVFNGWSNSINKATGLYNKACILSVVCDKNEFKEINLSQVNPKECFKSLKGISAHKISNLTPVKPIISIENNDKRFVSSQEIGIDSTTNLASMHWEDFEHLIREIFEQEFSINGGEVKVTQSSRDGGVDAIAFDPDPIRGGKIVIQAKRYTNIVGVSAVRDLYGTVMNEGATKGILVTTSDYGSDSFKFAKDKPITLINGGNLLYLLEKHGYEARIDIKEAKDELK